MLIGEITSGQRAVVSGVVRAARTPLTSPLTKRACVYWQVSGGLDVDAVEQEGSPFWIEDASGKVLVLDAPLDVDARARRAEQMFSMADADYREVSARLRAIKDRLKAAQGDARALHAERRQLSKVATLVCAIRAHARGRVHLGGSLRGQQSWIEANAQTAQSGLGAKTAELAVSRWEVAIEPGASVEIEAVFETQPVPPDLGAGGGYRDRPVCLVARALDTGSVRLTGVGALASSPEERAEREKPAKRGPPPSAQKRPLIDPTVAALVAAMSAAAFVAWLLWG